MFLLRRLIINDKLMKNGYQHHRKIARRKLSASISQKIEDRKLTRLAILRNAINEIFAEYSQVNNDDFDWAEVRKKLYERNLHFPTNFEFILLSAFDVNNIQSFNDDDEQQQFEMAPDLFQAITDFVFKSNALKSNKIASIRFCLFLSQYPHLLSGEQLNFIRQIALSVAADQAQIRPVIIDIVTALAHSSADNCKLAYKLLPKLLLSSTQTTSESDMSLRLDLVKILFNSLINHGLTTELLSFLSENSRYIDDIDLCTMKKLITLIGRTRISRKFSRENLLQMIEYIGDLHTPILGDDMPIFIDKILKQKLKYENIHKVHIDPGDGICPCCGHQLTGMNAQEFGQLKQHFKSIIFNANDQYMMDNLTEYHLQLLDFERKIQSDSNTIDDEPKFDLIIDGLNVSYRRSKSIVEDKTGLRTYAKVYKVKDIDNQIVTLIEHNQLMYRYRQILLIGREHMKTWFQLKRMCSRHKNVIDLCLLLDRTRDDNYILYAAIQHPKTMILSSDHFKDHRNKFNEWYRYGPPTTTGLNNENHCKPNLGLLFKRWLKSRQIRIEQGSMRLRYPNCFDVKIHSHRSNEMAWPILHVPFVIVPDQFNNDDHEIEWICAKL